MSHFTINLQHGSTGVSEVAEAAKRLNAAAAANWYNDAWRSPVIQAALTTVFEGFEHENIIPLLADVQTVAKGERIIERDVRGLEVFWVSTGGQIDQSTLTDDVWTMPYERVGFHISELIEKLQSNYSRISGDVVARATQTLSANLNTRLLRLYQAAIGTGSPYIIEGAGLSLPALNTALTEVKDTTNSDIVNIIGRPTMTDQIINELQDLNGFTPESNEQMLRLGVLGTYRKARIIELKNYRNGFDEPFIPANELYIAGQDAAKVGFHGGPEGQEWNEQGGFYWHVMGYRDVGMVVRKPENVRRVVDTSMEP